MLWGLTRQKRHLNPARCFELALDTGEFGFRAKYRSHDSVPKTKDEEEHSNRLDVRAWQNELAHVLIDSKEAEHHCAEHHDPLCQDRVRTTDRGRMERVVQARRR